ncbi:HlyD family type I secretion periplasmic adaptor subunit [Paracoccus sp. 11-3]|uniref:Membrane fusion protein (MFP) family protein n=1 Tax=Paracoccus amoyensis TaxID=2760093 RepID=A0A926GB85_9RHOB|nr:HlyD family type I secretion periplasmic adaptor subunit [Paracoccus amoyensis]MBC9247833.1 HlyD family type I secretion periplasmic adaptor subunit [Paracoccus amoyensis]
MNDEARKDSDKPKQPGSTEASTGSQPAQRSGLQSGLFSSRVGPPLPPQGPKATQPTHATRPESSSGPSQGKISPANPVQPPSPPPPPKPIAPPDPDRWSARGPLIAGIIAVFVLFGGFGIWALTSRIAGAVVATGQVEVEQQRQIVQHPDGGVVEQIMVKDGDEVPAGKLLIQLDGTLLRTELAIVQGQYFEILARRGRLEAERSDIATLTFPDELVEASKTSQDVADLIAGQSSLFETRRDTLRQSVDQLQKQSEQVQKQIEGIDAQIAALARQRELIGEELVDQESLLSRGLAQASRVLALQREAVRMDGQLGELTASRASAESRQTELEIQRLRLGSERREEAETELRDLGYRELELAERRRGLIEQISRLDIRAPVAGIVYNMQVTTPRSVVRPADPLLYLIPQDRPLVIGARVPVIHVDEIHPGQPVVLRFSAFSSRTTPEIDGTLMRVSADALIDEATKTSYYRAEVTIPPEQLEKLGDLALIPGMPVEVYIQTGERSPMAYLLKPMADYFNRAFRDN